MKKFLIALVLGFGILGGSFLLGTKGSLVSPVAHACDQEPC